MKLFVTGGTRGIGHHIVMTALAQGHDVAFTYCNPATDVKKLLAEAQKIAPNQQCNAYQLDVGNAEQVIRVVDKVIDDFDDMHAVINNAGINQNALAFSMTDTQWHDVINTNLSGTFYVMRAFLPVFLANQKGRFVAISSIAKDGISGQANYSASKAGVVGLSNTIGKEYGSKGITSNVIVPGIFATNMTEQTLSKDLQQFWMQHCPIKRIGRLEELSSLVMFLISDQASFINSQVISVTGGLDWAG